MTQSQNEQEVYPPPYHTAEYRVRPVVRYVVTEYISDTQPNGFVVSGCIPVGEFDNEDMAEKVKKALEAAHREAEKRYLEFAAEVKPKIDAAMGR